MMKNSDNKKTGEQRSEFRLNEEITIFIETHSSPSTEQQPATMVISKTIDLSANGIQIVIDKRLPLNSILRIGLETINNPQRFILAGEVVRQSEMAVLGQYSIGFQLIESEQTDIAEWKRYIAKRLAEDH